MNNKIFDKDNTSIIGVYKKFLSKNNLIIPIGEHINAN